MGKVTDEFIGYKCTFRVKNEDNDLSGEIQNVDRQNKTITFYKVTVHAPGKLPKVFSGLQHFHFDELKDLDILNEVNQGLRKASMGQSFEKHPVQGKKKGGLRHEKITRDHLGDVLEFDATLLYMMNIVEKEMDLTKDENGQYESKLPPDCTLLDNCSSQLFKDAMSHLKKCHTVGVAFEGVNLGRKGQLSWILVSTWEHTMFFDIKSMGKECFDSGLKGFLQSGNIMKVIHDCRRPSDILYHQYGTKLVNVFDTQVGAVHEFKALNKNNFPRYVTSLAECLRSELHLKDGDIHVPFLREHTPQKDEEVWNLRPAPSIVYQWMHTHSRHLLALQEQQMKLMMMEYTLGVDTYLKNLRDCYDVEAEIRMTRQHMLPTEYPDLPLLAKARLREELEKRKVEGRHNALVKDEQGWVDNWTGFTHPQIRASRDTIWHMRSLSKKRESENTSQDGQKETKVASQKREGCSDAKKEKHQDNLPSKQSVLRSDGQDPPSSSTPGKPDKGMPSSSAAISSLSASMASSSATDSMEEESPRPRPAPIVKTAPTLASPSAAGERNVSPALGGAKKPEAKAVASLTERTAALISQVTKERQEKERNGNNLHNQNYVFRPAGEMVQGISKKKLKEMQSSKTGTAAVDLAGKTGNAYSNPSPDQEIENEFDSIPFRSKLTEKPGSGQSALDNVFVFAPGKESMPKEKEGFSITTFKEAIPPPPYTVSEQTGKGDAGDALAAILPRVENPSLLLNGSRTDTPHLNSKPGTSRASCVTGNDLLALIMRNQRTVPTNHASASSDCTRSAGSSSRTLVRSPVSAQSVRESGPHPGGIKGGLCVLDDSAQKATDKKTANVSTVSEMNSLSSSTSVCTQSKVAASSGSSSTASPQNVPSSFPQTNAATEASRAVANTVPCSLSKNTGTVSNPTPQTSSSASVNSRVHSPLTGSNGLSMDELRKAIASGESVMSILGYNKSPQEVSRSYQNRT